MTSNAISHFLALLGYPMEEYNGDPLVVGDGSEGLPME
jgi:hypothetical protein